MAVDVELGRRAYSAVRAGAGWLTERARSNGNFADDYTMKISGHKEIGTPMPIAECLMALLTTREKKYLPFELPCPSDEELESLGLALLASIKKEGLSGWPYVRPKEHPEFTDAANYCLGAIAKIVRLATEDRTIVVRDSTLRSLQAEGHRLVKKLLDHEAKQTVRIRKQYAAGWTWTIQNSKDRPHPISLYFTTQTITTLLEVLFEAPFLLREGSTDISKDVMDSLSEAKFFLLETLINKTDAARVGWPNINTTLLAEALAGGKKGDPEKYLRETGYPHFEKTPDADARMSLYAIEALSYFRYYKEAGEFQRRQGELQSLHEQSYNDLVEIPEEEKQLIGPALRRFFTAVDADAEASGSLSSFQPVQIHIPIEYNAVGGKGGGWYSDGTTPYNALNTLIFSREYFGEEVGGAFQAGDADARMARLADNILGQAFDEVAFLHVDEAVLDSTGKTEGLRAIYATRTALSTLLSSNLVQGHTSPERLDVGLIRQLIAQLGAAVGGAPQPVSGDVAAGRAIDPDVLRRLLLAAYSVGAVTDFFADRDMFSDTNRTQGTKKGFWNEVVRGEFSIERLTRANGVELIELLVDIGLGAPEEEIFKRLTNLAENPHLNEAIRGWLAEGKLTRAKDGNYQFVGAVGFPVARQAETASASHIAQDLLSRLLATARDEQRQPLIDQLSTLRKDLL